MSLTDSTMMPLGTLAPAFELTDTLSQADLGFDDVAGAHATVVVFICNHCPYVIHIADELVSVAAHYRVRGIGFVAISSNDVAVRPEDGPESMAEFARVHHFDFPYLYDESQDVAKSFNAVCTPDFFVFDGHRRCAYRGQFDGARPGNETPVTGADLRAALDSLIEGQAPSVDEQVPSQGCSIKWRS
ncbi:thioredoxin family protein [Salinisphaera sp. USBA-960]|uniref:thioredoxin family protein n=1 Tax=Salinisphaera orenii TaxID=856731 RepID=UPI000DBE587A|nr:thioredoxin family protein [Salifodinibacter halophilus]NNC26496.1 thioredoxin family protein [Salifodinibacter halophilus]